MELVLINYWKIVIFLKSNYLWNIDELAEKLVYLYKDRKKLKELAINGFDFAKKFTEGNAADEVYDMITKLS